MGGQDLKRERGKKTLKGLKRERGEKILGRERETNSGKRTSGGKGGERSLGGKGRRTEGGKRP